MKNLFLIAVWMVLLNLGAKAAEQPTSPRVYVPVSRTANVIVGEEKERLGVHTLSLKPVATGIQLNWKVEETTDLQYFLIEQAVDGQHFFPLFEVPVQPHQLTYWFVDAGVKANNTPVYYRIKAVYTTKVVASPVRKLTV